MYIKRHIEQEIRDMAAFYPVVTLTGPRQCGKTTVIKHLFHHYPYINLEAPDMLDEVKADPRRFLRLHKEGVIIDEIQRYPELLSYIQVIVDEEKKLGQFILTGSNQLELTAAVSQSLAGRTALLNLLPLSMTEVGENREVDNYIFSGFYPRIYEMNILPVKYYRDYVGSYVERDIRQLIHVKDINLFKKCLKLLAGRIGQILNYQNLANEVGVSGHTIKSWLSILEALYIIKLLPPYFENFGKRAIKSPKIFFIDVGLACYLLGIREMQQVARDPLRGALFENMVIMEFFKMRYNKGETGDLYFFRDNNQNEVDLVFKQGAQLVPVEIKSSETFQSYFLKGLDRFNEMVNNIPPIGFLIYAGEKSMPVRDFHVLNFHDIPNIEKKLN